MLTEYIIHFITDDSSEYLLSRSSILSLMMSMKMLMVLMVRAMEDVGSSGSEFSTDMVISVDLPTHVMNLKTTTSSLGTIVYISQPASLVLLSTYYDQLPWCYRPHITTSSLGTIVHISWPASLVLLSTYYNQLSWYYCPHITISSLGTIVHISGPALSWYYCPHTTTSSLLVLLSPYHNQLSWCYCPQITTISLHTIVPISQPALSKLPADITYHCWDMFMSLCSREPLKRLKMSWNERQSSKSSAERLPFSYSWTMRVTMVMRCCTSLSMAVTLTLTLPAATSSDSSCIWCHKFTQRMISALCQINREHNHQ